MSEELVEAGRYFSLPEAEVVKTMLEGCGIRAEVFGDNQGNMVPYQAMVSPTRVMVPANRLKEALDLLAQGLPEAEQGPEHPEDEIKHEPDSPTKLVKRITLATVLGFVILPVVAQIYALVISPKAFKHWSELTRGQRVKLVTCVVLNLAVLVILEELLGWYD